MDASACHEFPLSLHHVVFLEEHKASRLRPFLFQFYFNTSAHLSKFLAMSNGFLRVEGEKVVDGKGNTVILRGAGLGGWMNMENFMYMSSFPNDQYIY